MNGEALIEAYQRFYPTGPEWGEDRLTNHGPMAAEVLVRRGHEAAVGRWVGTYIRRLDELPPATDPISEESWRAALGDGRRLGDWNEFFTRQLAEQPWQALLATWWPRLLPGIAAGATHGVIRTGHVVRTLLAGEENSAALGELGHALGFWAARARQVPAAREPSGQLEPQAALDAVPRIPAQQGGLADRLGQLAGTPGWQASLAALQIG